MVWSLPVWLYSQPIYTNSSLLPGINICTSQSSLQIHGTIDLQLCAITCSMFVQFFMQELQKCSVWCMREHKAWRNIIFHSSRTTAQNPFCINWALLHLVRTDGPQRAAPEHNWSPLVRITLNGEREEGREQSLGGKKPKPTREQSPPSVPHTGTGFQR